MKIRRLPDIDLARIAVLPEEEQRFRLMKLSLGHPPHTYAPTRACVPDLLNEQSDLLGSANITPWEKIDQVLKAKATHEKEYLFNRAVSKSLYQFAVTNGVMSRRKLITNWSVGFGQSVSFWWNLYAVLSGRACFPFIDPRISNPLTGDARRFAFSVMHERIRVPDPDFHNARLVIVQFAKGDDNERILRLHDSDGIDLIEFSVLNEMVTRTYSLWIEVLREREAALRTGTDDIGPLFRR